MFIKNRNTKLRLLTTYNLQLTTKKRAFTLIELLVVVAIIGVLAAIVIINLTGAKASSRYAKTVSEMTEIAKSVNVYRETHNDTWPTAWTGGGVAFDGSYLFTNDPNTNDFLKDMYNGQMPEPECDGAKYAYYIVNADPSSGYIAIIYFPVSSSWKAASLSIAGGSGTANTDGCIDIREKPTKRITCNERTYSAASGTPWTFNQ